MLFYRTRNHSSKLECHTKIPASSSSTGSQGAIIATSRAITVQLHQLGTTNHSSSIHDDGESPHSMRKRLNKLVVTPGYTSKPVTKQAQPGPFTMVDRLSSPILGSTHGHKLHYPSSSVSVDHGVSMRTGSCSNLPPVELPEREELQLMASTGSRLPPLNRPRGKFLATVEHRGGLQPKRKLPKIGTADVEMAGRHDGILLF